MMSDKIEEKVQEALNRHNRGYNCFPSPLPAHFVKNSESTEATMFR